MRERRRLQLPVLAAALLAALSLPPLLAGCDGAVPEPPAADSGVPVAFDVTALPAHAQTRAGEITTANITSMGVFAAYTEQGNFNDSNSPLNYMYNQRISRTNGTSPWTYAPVKYWPNKAGEKISFFAYAPHTDNLPAGCLTLPASSHAGELSFVYAPPTDASQQADLLVAATPDLTKAGGTVGLTFGHITAKITFRVLSSEDITVNSVKIGDATTSATFYLGAAGFRWGTPTKASGITYTATPGKSVATDTPTDVATFFMLPNDTKTEEPVTGNDTKVTLEYTPTGAGSTPQSKTATLPRGWQEGEAVNFALKLDRVKLTVTVVDEGGMTWGGSNTEEEIEDSTAF